MTSRQLEKKEITLIQNFLQEADVVAVDLEDPFEIPEELEEKSVEDDEETNDE